MAQYRHKSKLYLLFHTCQFKIHKSVLEKVLFCDRLPTFLYNSSIRYEIKICIRVLCFHSEVGLFTFFSTIVVISNNGNVPFLDLSTLIFVDEPRAIFPVDVINGLLIYLSMAVDISDNGDLPLLNYRRFLWMGLDLYFLYKIREAARSCRNSVNLVCPSQEFIRRTQHSRWQRTHVEPMSGWNL